MGTSTLAADEVKVSWEAVEKAIEAGEKYILNRDGNPAFVIPPLELWNALQDRLEELEDAVDSDRIMAAIESGEQETVAWEVIRERLIAEESPDE